MGHVSPAWKELVAEGTDRGRKELRETAGRGSWLFSSESWGHLWGRVGAGIPVLEPAGLLLGQPRVTCWAWEGHIKLHKERWLCGQEATDKGSQGKREFKKGGSLC